MQKGVGFFLFLFRMDILPLFLYFYGNFYAHLPVGLSKENYMNINI